MYDFFAGNIGTITGFDLFMSVTQPICAPSAAEETTSRTTDVCPAGGAGNANGFWDAGENAELRVTLRNTGQFDLTHVYATLAPITPGVIMIDDTASWPDIPRFGTALSIAPHFTAYLPTSFACAAPLTFAVTIHSDQGTFTDATVDAGISGHPIGPGVATDLFETFTGGIPASWTIDDKGTGGGAASTWTTANPGSRAATSPIAAPFVIIDSLAAGSGATQDERMTTPPVNETGFTNIILEFDTWFNFSAGGGSEKGDVDVISTLTGGNPTNVFRYQSSSANPEHRVIDITALAAGAPDVQIRFKYSGGPLDNWWMIDNVKITHGTLPFCANVTCPVTTVPSEVLHMNWDSKTAASWTPAAGATSYSLYRGVAGDLSKLLTPATDSCTRVTTPTTAATGITENPAPGTFTWWLVRASNTNGTGSAGSATTGTRIQNASGTCP